MGSCGRKFLVIGKSSKTLTSFLLCIFAVLFLQGKALAHKVYLFAYEKGSRIVCEGYFIDGKKAANAKIEVFDKKTNKKIVEGKADRKGAFSFVKPKYQNLKIVINAGMGHKAEFDLSTSGLIKAEAEEAQKQAPDAEKQTPVQTSKTQVKSVSGISLSDIKKLVDASLDEKLDPVIRSLAKPEGGSQVQKVMSGLGYIFGLMGLIMYISNKKK